MFVLIKSFTFDSDTLNISLEMGIHTAWTVAETNLAVISGKNYSRRRIGFALANSFLASLPMLRPVMRKVLPQGLLTSYGEGGSGTAQSIDYMSRGLKLNHISTSQERIAKGSSPLQRAESAAGPVNSEAGYSSRSHDSSVFITSALRKYPSSKTPNDSKQGNNV